MRKLASRIFPCMNERSDRESALDQLRAHTARSFADTIQKLEDTAVAVDALKTAFDH